MADPTGPSPWPWPDSLDAVLAAPSSHRVLFENEHTRVLEVTIAPGEREPEHTTRGRASWWSTSPRAFATTPRASSPSPHRPRTPLLRPGRGSVGWTPRGRIR